MEYDTIAALSTPSGRGGIGIVRISGPSAFQILKKIITPFQKKREPRKLIHGFIHRRHQRIDECLFVFFPSPNSFTGEDTAEISLHANPFLIEETLKLIFKNGARMALPGEFTYRAYKNGKIDLLQAEAVNDLICANSRYLAQMEFAALQGRLSKSISEIREKLIELAVKIETIIEFQEDQCMDKIEVEADLSPIAHKIRELLRHSRFNDILNHGMKIVIAGKVNVGKSTLFNALLQEDRSIISSFPGTTRDFIKEKLYIDGFPFEITDIAGLQWQAASQIEREGMARSLVKIKEADAVVFVLDASQKVDAADRRIFSLIADKNKLLVANKSDIAKKRVLQNIEKVFSEEKIVCVSAKKAENMQAIYAYLQNLGAKFQKKSAGVAINFRQKNLLEVLHNRIEMIVKMMRQNGNQLETMAEEIRSALKTIGELTGEISSEDILKEIFGRFCIGK